jgi:FkbM family methyltransferase
MNTEYKFNSINRLITIKNNDDTWIVELNNSIGYFLPGEDLPLNVQFLNSYTKKIIWECKLNPSCWVSYPAGRNIDLQILTASGKILYYVPFDQTKYFDPIEDAFCNYIITNNLKNGVVIGAGDGSYGEWLNPVIKGLTNALLIEANKKEFEILYKDFKQYSNISFLNKGVDVENSQREFFICPEWLGISSLIKENILNFKIEEKNILSEIVECESLNSLLKKETYDWLRLDVEGLDSSLIFSLEDDVLKNLRYLQYEHINITENERIETNSFLEKHGFNVFTVGIDTVSVK